MIFRGSLKSNLAYICSINILMTECAGWFASGYIFAYGAPCDHYRGVWGFGLKAFLHRANDSRTNPKPNSIPLSTLPKRENHRKWISSWNKPLEVSQPFIRKSFFMNILANFRIKILPKSKQNLKKAKKKGLEIPVWNPIYIKVFISVK